MKNFTTRLLFVTLFICFSFSILSRKSQAASFTSSKQIYLLENGDYLETIITGTPAFSNNISYLSSSKSITKTKTSKYKSKNGLTLWSVSIKATFTYNGRTSKCTSYSHSTTCPSSAWKIKTVTSSKNGSSATATAVATHSRNNTQKNFTKSVTISCNSNGIVS